ncbi:hypothetical protein QBC43DRAFT_359760 [Cladorrhinum sp. PSN259]|nr:hypothetical protein QBC43DRAFT_359760 [Cladorrhinum sp. PSN259]
MDKFKTRRIIFSAQVPADDAALHQGSAIRISGSGQDEMGETTARGTVSLVTGEVDLVVGVGDGNLNVGWEYKGTVNWQRRAMGGTWRVQKSPTPAGTFYFYALAGAAER